MLIAHITDLSMIDFLQPTAVISGNWMKNRSYLTVGRDAYGQVYDAPVYAPADSRLIGITYYLGLMQNEQGELVEVPQYDLRFQVSCEVTYGFDHLETLSDNVAALAPSTPVRDTRDAMVNVSLELKAGDLIAHTTGTIQAHTWDFILSNSTKRNTFANQERYENDGDLQRLLHGDCAYDYFDDAMRQAYYDLFGGHQGGGDYAICEVAYDVPGTVAGAWFQRPFAGMDFSNPGAGWGVIVGVSPDGFVNVNGEGISIRVRPGDDTHLIPATITSAHCYESSRNTGGREGWHAYIELLSDYELAVAFGDGSCPKKLPSDHQVFFR